jgi:Calx-beta domain
MNFTRDITNSARVLRTAVGDQVSSESWAGARKHQTSCAVLALIHRLDSMRTRLSVLIALFISGQSLAALAQAPGLFRVSRGSLRHAENLGHVRVSVVRESDPSRPATVAFRTRDLTAKAAKDYAVASARRRSQARPFPGLLRVVDSRSVRFLEADMDG